MSSLGDMYSNPWLVPVLTLSLLVSYLFCLGVYNVFFHPLARFPGPKLWAAYRLTYVISLQSGQLHVRIKEFHDRYGSIVRIAPHELSFTDPKAYKDIYGNRPGHLPFERNPTWFKAAKSGNPQSIMGPNEEAHARYRKTLVHAFSDKSLKEQAPMIEGHVDALVRKLREISKDSITDLVQWLNFTTFDIAGDLCFGESFDCLKNGKAHPWVEVSYDFGKGLALIAAVNFYPPLDRLLRLVIPKQIMQRTADHIAMSRAKVMNRLSIDSDRPDFVTHILKQNKENESKAQKKAMSPAEIGLNMTVLIFAGSETTASGLAGIMRMLLQNQDKLTKLVDEVRSSFTHEGEIAIASVGQLEYLGAVINEGLRLCPPVVIGVPRIAPAGGELVCGQFVPQGTFVTVNQYPIDRSKHNFSNPDVFMPERFLSSSTSDDLSAFQPFHLGRHSCIGQSLAYAEMRLVLARLIYGLDFQLADPRDVWDWGTQKTFIFWEKEPLRVFLRHAVR